MENGIEKIALWTGVVVLAATVVVLFQHATHTTMITDSLKSVFGMPKVAPASTFSSATIFPQIFPTPGPASYAASQAVQAANMPDVGAPYLYLQAPINPGYLH